MMDTNAGRLNFPAPHSRKLTLYRWEEPFRALIERMVGHVTAQQQQQLLGIRLMGAIIIVCVVLIVFLDAIGKPVNPILTLLAGNAMGSLATLLKVGGEKDVGRTEREKKTE